MTTRRLERPRCDTRRRRDEAPRSERLRRLVAATLLATAAGCGGDGGGTAPVPTGPLVAVLAAPEPAAGGSATSALVAATDLATVRELPGFLAGRPASVRTLFAEIAPDGAPRVRLAADTRTTFAEPQRLVAWRYDAASDAHTMPLELASALANPDAGTPRYDVVLPNTVTFARDGATLLAGAERSDGGSGALVRIAGTPARATRIVEGSVLATTPAPAGTDAGAYAIVVPQPGTVPGTLRPWLHRIAAASWTSVDSIPLPAIPSSFAIPVTVAVSRTGDIVVRVSAQSVQVPAFVRCRFAAPRGCGAPVSRPETWAVAPLPDGSGWYDATCRNFPGTDCGWLRFRDNALQPTDSIRVPSALAGSVPSLGLPPEAPVFVVHAPGTLITGIERTTLSRPEGPVPAWAPWRLERSTGTATRGAVRAGNVIGVVPCCTAP